MSSERVIDHLRGMRLGEVGTHARRVMGLPYLRRSDFIFEATPPEIARLREIALVARGEGPRPVLVLGVMPRSGTNFVHDLIGLDAGIHADPGQLYEFPLLHCVPEAAALCARFTAYFPRNAARVGRHDMLARLAGAWLRELQLDAGDRRILLKCPHVQYLTLAPLIFPDSDIVICLRDGRDVIESTQRTFKNGRLRRKSFAQLAHEWRLATEAACVLSEAYPQVTLVRFEDLVAAPQRTARRLVDRIGLDPATFPFEEVDRLPVRGSSRSTRSAQARWQPEAKTTDFQPVGRWAGWSRRQTRRFDRIAGAALARAGYARAHSG